MRNVAVIFAGGTGTRMKNTEKPKQFLMLDGKSILQHTIEKFEECDLIDAISIACKSDYIDTVSYMIKQAGIRKVRWIVPGGETGQLSIFNGLKAVFSSGETNGDTIVLVHDGVRPIIDQHLIEMNIKVARKQGSAITVVPATETVFESRDGQNIDSLLDRNVLFYARAPQTFFLNELIEVQEKEIASGMVNNIDSCSMMFKHGKKLHFVLGKSSNIKITTYEDFFIFKALYELERDGKYGDVLQ